MKNLRQVVLGILAALLSSALVLGGFAVSLVESGVQVAARPSQTASPIPFTPAPTQLPGLPTYTPSATPTPSPTATIPPPTNCPPPAGWVPVTVQFDETVSSLAAAYGTTPEKLASANCLITETIKAGSVVYVPPPPTATQTATSTWTPTPTQAPVLPSTPLPTHCPPPPANWVLYLVRPGDTLYHLSAVFGVSVQQLQAANCMGRSVNLVAGKYIYVPFLPPTRTPYPTSAFASPTPPPRPTKPSPLPTSTPTYTPRPSDTLVPTRTPVPPTATHTPIPPTPTAAPTNTPVPPTPTTAPVSTATPTSAPLPTQAKATLKATNRPAASTPTPGS